MHVYSIKLFLILLISFSKSCALNFWERFSMLVKEMVNTWSPNVAFVVLCSFIAHTSYSCSFYLQKHSSAKTAGTDTHVGHSTIMRNMLVRGTTSVVQLGVLARLDVRTFLWWLESGATIFLSSQIRVPSFAIWMLSISFKCNRFSYFLQFGFHCSSFNPNFLELWEVIMLVSYI